MIRFLHTADIHLDSPLVGLQRYDGAPVEQLRGATRQALENLVRLALQREVQFVVVAGDLYDGDWRDHNTGLYFVKQLSRLQEAGIAVYVIAGNHDAASRMTRSLRLPPNPSGDAPLLGHDAAETRVLDDLGVAIHGRSFATAAETENLVRHYPAALPGLFNLGLLHTSLEGDAQHATYAPCSRDDLLAKEYQYWALGHVHRRQVLEQSPYIAYCGNLQGRHIRETGAKGCLLVEVDARQQVRVEFQPLDVVRWELCEVDCTGAATTAEVLDRFRSTLSGLLGEHGERTMALRVQLHGNCAVHQVLAARSDDWTAELRAAAIDVGRGNVWIEKTRLATRPTRRSRHLALGSGPVEEMLALLRQLHVDDDLLADFEGEWESLRGKLPPEVLGGPEAVDWRDRDWLRELLRDVEPMLLERLAPTEER